MTQSTLIQTPALPPVASREEWLAARMALLAREKEATRARDALNAERRRLPMVRVEKEYVFQGPDGSATLLDLFEGRRQLVVYHFMWLDATEEGCPSCSMMVDLLGNLAHLNAANTTYAVISRGPIEKLEAFRKRMGWNIPLYSSSGTDFNYDFQVTIDRSRGAVEYNYRDISSLWEGYEGDMHGQSVFLRDDDSVYHTYSTYARGVEPAANVFNILDLTPLGRQEEDGIQNWVRHHDRYETAPAATAKACCG